jgi:hypothetical protein
MLVAPATGETLVIENNEPATQGTDYLTFDPFDSETTEARLDRIMMVIHRALDLGGRAVKLPITDDPDTPADVSLPVPEAGKFLQGTAALDGWENVDIAGLGAIGVPVSVANGGTGSTTAAAARTALAVAGLADANTFTVLNTFDGGIKVRSTDAGAGAGPDIIIDRDSASPAASDLIGRILFRGNDVSLGNDDYISIIGRINDPTSGSEDGRLLFNTLVAGSDATRLNLAAGLWTQNATDGDKGVDTINASGLYRDGVLVEGTLGSIQTFTANGTYNKPAGLLRAEVIVLGSGGGGGGSSATNNRVGGGGGGGGGSYKVIEASAIGSTEAITIGAAGAAGAATGAGGNGNTSSFGAHASATGGTGGPVGTSNAVGGAGGTGSGGDVNLTGQRGGPANSSQFSSNNGAGGDAAGLEFGGGGGPAGFFNGVGQAAAEYGGGGGGGNRNGVSAAGGAGAAGFIIVKEYF